MKLSRLRHWKKKTLNIIKGYTWSVEEIDHTHIKLIIEKILLGDERDIEGRLFYYQGINDPESGYRTPMCETCTGPMWRGEKAIIFVSLESSGLKDALITGVLPFVNEDTINSRPAEVEAKISESMKKSVIFYQVIITYIAKTRLVNSGIETKS